MNLYDVDFKGCKSCFACKIKNSKTNGVCALKDDLRPVLERCRQADVIVLGSPVYYSYPTGEIRAFMERLMFPMGTYLYENGKHIILRDRVIPSAMIFTMNCPEDYMKTIGYPTLLEENTKVMADIFGYAETLYMCNTYQFNDYSRYDFNLFSEEGKRNIAMSTSTLTCRTPMNWASGWWRNRVNKKSYSSATAGCTRGVRYAVAEGYGFMTLSEKAQKWL